MAIIILFAFGKGYGQEYKYEVGTGLGMSSYMGDANKTNPFYQPRVAGGVIYRYNLDFHWAIKSNLLAGNLYGNTANTKNVFPHEGQASFSRTFFEIGAQAEYNFFAYSDKYLFLGTRRYTPYMFMGIGSTFAGGKSKFLNANIPIGLGFKYKPATKWNVGMEFSIRKLFGDNLDVTELNPALSLENPYGIKSSFLKNKDWYTLTMIYITWEFGMRSDPCHNN